MVELKVKFAVETCCNCGMTFAVPQDFQNRRRNDHKSFFCPAGHKQYWAVESEKEILKQKLVRCQLVIEDQGNHLDFARNSIRTYKGHVTKKKNQINELSA